MASKLAVISQESRIMSPEFALHIFNFLSSS